jgi:hypothetical protein
MERALLVELGSGRVLRERVVRAAGGGGALGGDGLRAVATVLALHYAAESSLRAGLRNARLAGRAVFAQPQGERAVALCFFREHVGDERGAAAAMRYAQGLPDQLSGWACCCAATSAGSSRGAAGGCLSCARRPRVHSELPPRFLPETLDVATRAAAARALALGVPVGGAVEVRGERCHVLPLGNQLLLVQSDSLDEAAEWLAGNLDLVCDALDLGDGVDAVRPAEPT